jgi:hypothetical protein
MSATVTFGSGGGTAEPASRLASGALALHVVDADAEVCLRDEHVDEIGGEKIGEDGVSVASALEDWTSVQERERRLMRRWGSAVACPSRNIAARQR